MRKTICFSLLMSVVCLSCMAVETLPANDTHCMQIAAQESACQGYDQEFIELIEMIYGNGFLSQGSQQSVEKMVCDLDLEGAHILDIGSGLGAPALYLAEHYNTNVVGAEPQEWMVERANANLKDVQDKLKGSASFVVLEDPSNLRLFSDAFFDVIFSKEALLHVPLVLKEGFFREIYRVLKPGGSIVILDWLHSSPNYSLSTRKMMEMDGVAFHLITPDEYLTALDNAGFDGITMENTSMEHAGFSLENIRTIEALSAEIQSKFGKDIYEYCIESWSYQKEAFQSGEIITAIFKAIKK